MEGLFILAKKEGALEEIERHSPVHSQSRCTQLVYIHQGHINLVVPVISLLLKFIINFDLFLAYSHRDHDITT